MPRGRKKQVEEVTDFVPEDLPGVEVISPDEPENDYADLEPADDGLVPFYLSSSIAETYEKQGQKFAYGNVNGKRFEVVCDVQTRVKPEIKEVFSSLIKKAKNPQAFADSLKVVV